MHTVIVVATRMLVVYRWVLQGKVSRAMIAKSMLNMRRLSKSTKK